MKTAELTGDALDFLVAKAEGMNGVFDSPLMSAAWDSEREEVYSPSTNWAQGGPIMERERIMLMPFWDGYYRATIGVVGHPMCGDPIPAYDETYSATGHTHLIAAMRAYVSSVFGPDVDAKA